MKIYDIIDTEGDEIRVHACITGDGTVSVSFYEGDTEASMFFDSETLEKFNAAMLLAFADASVMEVSA